MSPPRLGDSSCGDVRALLSPSLDGALDAAARERVAGHVARCADCAEELAELRAPGERIASAFSGVKARADFLDRLLYRVERSIPRLSDPTLTRTLERACAAAALLLVALLLAVTRVGRVSAVAPDIERILGTSAELAAGSTADSAAPHTESELLEIILGDPSAPELIEENDR